MAKFLDVTGQKFTRLTAQWPAGRTTAGGIHWLCLCDCGNLRVVTLGALRSGAQKSCGCWKRDIQRARNLRHGHTKHGQPATSTYTAWANMLRRCDNPNNPEYKNYGARGIRVCRRWYKFENFLADMGEKPAAHLTIERVNNNKGYVKSNCTWATRSEQALNKRPRYNPCGYTGVTFAKDRGKYRAQIKVNGKGIMLGAYPTAELAHAAYLEAREKHFGKQ